MTGTYTIYFIGNNDINDYGQLTLISLVSTAFVIIIIISFTILILVILVLKIKSKSTYILQGFTFQSSIEKQRSYIVVKLQGKTL